MSDLIKFDRSSDEGFCGALGWVVDGVELKPYFANYADEVYVGIDSLGVNVLIYEVDRDPKWYYKNVTLTEPEAAVLADKIESLTPEAFLVKVRAEYELG